MAKIIGLTGGIASGKSTVSTFLKENGYAVVDADALVHQLQAKGGRLYQVLVEHFGETILTADGQLDRPKLSTLLFSDKGLLEKSAELQDGIIREELEKEKSRLVKAHDLVFLDIPLLFEKGFEDWCDVIWLVAVDEEIQIQRLMARNGYDEKAARQRIATQMSLAEKIKRSHVVIDNNGSLDKLYQQLETVIAELL